MKALANLRLQSFLVVVLLLMGANGYAAEVRVPADHPTIQGAIDAATDGDTIIVSPGTYGQIHFRGKTITIRSENPYDPSVVDSTIIRGESSKVATVTFDGGEGKETTLSGFTITGAGNGIDCPSSSPTLRDNAIVNCGKYGIQAFALSRDTIPMPHIHGNMISGNTLGGIYFRGAPVITGNTIENNKGINACLGEGWGPVVITGNTINGNEHEAVGASVPFSEGLGVLTDNTIIGNGGGVGFGGNVIITRNLLVQNRGPLLCYEGTCHDNVVVDGGGIWSYNAFTMGNKVEGNWDYGIYLDAGGAGLSNVIAGSLGDGVRTRGGSVISNTIVKNHPHLCLHWQQKCQPFQMMGSPTHSRSVKVSHSTTAMI